MKSSRIVIEHQCPQCGAPATLEETDHLFTCGFCRVKSYLLSRTFRYMLPHAAPPAKEVLYFPYWRFKGLLFACVADGIQNRITDVSYQALACEHFPLTLGLRSQTLRLRFVSPETEGCFLRPSLPYREVLEIVEGRYRMALPKPLFHQSFVGESLSQIYAPFYVDSRVHDAVLNRPVSAELPPDLDPETFQGGRPDWRLAFIPALCPHCGWDLEGERDALVLHCGNCNSAWYPARKQLRRLKFVRMPEKGEGLTYLPFYRISARTLGLELESYADLVTVANLPKVVQAQWHDVPFHYWSAAFKVRPRDFLNFGRNLTLSQPEGAWAADMPAKGAVHPVTLPVEEAVEGLKITLASFMKPRSSLFPRLPSIEIHPQSAMLVYIPFHRKGNELSQPAYRLRINRNLLAYARNL